jgi:hypothetical protein
MRRRALPGGSMMPGQQFPQPGTGTGQYL